MQYVAVAWQQGTTARTDQIKVHCCHALACICQGERVLCGAWPAQALCGSAQWHCWSVRLEKPGRNLGGVILSFFALEFPRTPSGSPVLVELPSTCSHMAKVVFDGLRREIQSAPRLRSYAVPVILLKCLNGKLVSISVSTDDVERGHGLRLCEQVPGRTCYAAVGEESM